MDVLNCLDFPNSVDVLNLYMSWISWIVPSEIRMKTIRYGESIGPKLKTAIMVAMIPNGVKDDLLKHSCMQTSLKYDVCKDYLIKFSNQEAALSKVTPKTSINQMGEGDAELDALSKGKGKGKGGTCWNCGGKDICRHNVPLQRALEKGKKDPGKEEQKDGGERDRIKGRQE